MSRRVSPGRIGKKPVNFSFDGRSFQGYAGDTLASALLANDQMLLGRSFKYHRPRGLITLGSEEPNALVTIGSGARQTPNTRATTQELYEGLSASSQNRYPSLKFDLLSVNDRLSRFLTAGFYYKTFMWPRSFWESVYEPLIRRAAGLGKLSEVEDADQYDKGFLHCDCLVIGGGIAGLEAALEAAHQGKAVILCDENPRLGGMELFDSAPIDSVEGLIKELQSLSNVRLMSRTTVQGAFDHGVYSALTQNTDHLAQPHKAAPRQTLWRIYSSEAVLASGAHERMIAFDNNDRPGVMLSSALRGYLNYFGVLAGDTCAVFGCHDDARKTVVDLHAAGAKVIWIDTRSAHEPVDGVQCFTDARVVDTRGRHRLKGIEIEQGGERFWLPCDALGVAGGWNPRVQLTCHQGGRPRWSNDVGGFISGTDLPPGMRVVGAAAGEYLRGNWSPVWDVSKRGSAFVDPQNDVTVKDIKLAHQEGFISVEHLKRYTTLGMATDQGKNANTLGIGVLSQHTGNAIESVGTTLFRPPYTPVAIGALAGRARGKAFKPTRLTPSHEFATRQGASFVTVGNWLRAAYFPQAGETHWRESVDREALAVRNAVGVCDVTTLGKIDVQGRDAAQFLNLVYANGFLKLPVGKTRYGLMLREDGIVFDDGTAARLSENHFVVTTTTANAVPVYRHMEFVHQCLAPNLDVHLISTTESWAQFAVAGPRSRELLQRIVDLEISNEAFGFMACAETRLLDGTPARLFRISFSGELAYELAVPARFGNSLMQTLLEVGADLGATPYGTEALGVLRIEKGHAAGNELDGRTTAVNLGLGQMVAQTKDSIGRVLANRDLLANSTLRLVGFRSDQQILTGSWLIPPGRSSEQDNTLGWVSSACYSPNLGCYIAIGFISDADQYLGAQLRAVSLLDKVDVGVSVVSPHFIDPEGERLRV
ncbi:MAG TPA: 2Fe-2S iron-sulfur cluster-binding protein [Marinobacterium sp.]|nr:2Fe-2S iron-sulfur cluster-binding protein [Marinobacterium sp.]